MHLNLLLERQSVSRYNGKNFRKHFKIVHVIDFKDGNCCRHTFSLIEKVETPWEGLEYLVIGKVLERRLWQLEIFFSVREVLSFRQNKRISKKKVFPSRDRIYVLQNFFRTMHISKIYAENDWNWKTSVLSDLAILLSIVYL